MPSRDGGRPTGQGRREGCPIHPEHSDEGEDHEKEVKTNEYETGLSYPDKRDCGVSQRAKRTRITRMTRIYISGPISGIDRAVYLSAFAEAERRLRAKGYDTLNPTRLPPSRWLWIYKVLGYRLTLLYDLWHLMRCDGITMLAGWEQSRGARLEKATADIFNIKEIEL